MQEKESEVILTFDHLLKGSRFTPLFIKLAAKSLLRVYAKMENNIDKNTNSSKENTRIKSSCRHVEMVFFTFKVLVRRHIGRGFSKASMSSTSSTTGNI